MITTQPKKDLVKHRRLALSALFPDMEEREIQVRMAMAFSNVCSCLDKFRGHLERPSEDQTTDRDAHRLYEAATTALAETIAFMRGKMTPTRDEVQNLLLTLQHGNILKDDDNFTAAKRRVCKAQLWDVLIQSAQVDGRKLRQLASGRRPQFA